MLAAELADSGYLTEAYRRRIRALRVEVAASRSLPRDERSTATPAAAPVAIPPIEVPVRRAAVRTEHAPVNVPSDEARRKAFAARRASQRAKGGASS